MNLKNLKDSRKSRKVREKNLIDPQESGMNIYMFQISDLCV